MSSPLSPYAPSFAGADTVTVLVKPPLTAVPTVPVTGPRNLEPPLPPPPKPREFHVSSALLKHASPVFATMLEGPWVEAQERCITVDGLTPTPVPPPVLTLTPVASPVLTPTPVQPPVLPPSNP